MSRPSKTIAALRTIEIPVAERQAAEEQQWREACPEVADWPGMFWVDGEMISNEGARASWAERNDPTQLMALLQAGRADSRSQRVAAEIIAQAAAKPLPQRRDNIARRDRWIAMSVYELRESGVPAGDAHTMAATAFGLSVETVRKVAARADLVEWAVLTAFEWEVRRRQPPVG